MRQSKAIRKLRANTYSREYAETHGLRILSSKQYQDEFFVTAQTVSRRIRVRKIKAFKEGNRWFVLVK